MPFTPFLNGASVNIKCSLFGEICENRLMFRYAGDPGSGELEDLAFGVYNWWYDYVRQHISTDVIAVQVVARGQSSVVEPVAEAIITPGTGGLVGGPAMPSFNSYSVSIKTPYAGRSARGRISFYGFAEGEVAANVLAPTRVAGFRAAAQALIGLNSVASGWQYGIASKQEGGATLPTYTFRGASGLGSTTTRIGTQNTRKPGRGQ